MDNYANLGLRTLMFAMKEFSSDFITNKLKEMPDDVFENEIYLLGITGLEDLLQDNVK